MKPARRTPIAITLFTASLALAAAPVAPAAAHSTPGQSVYHGYSGSWFAPQMVHPGAGGMSILQDSRPLISLALQHRQDLELTLDQVEQLEALRDAFARRYRREREELRNMSEDLRKSLRGDAADLADAGKRIRAIEGKRAALRLARLHAIEKGKAVLTPVQLKKLMSLLRKGSYPARKNRPGEWHFPGMHFQFGPWGPHHPHERRQPGGGTGKKAPEPQKKDF